MKKSGSQKSKSPSQLIDARIKELGDWRGKMLSRLRTLVKEADPEVVEEWKWRGVPVWSHDGLICTGETYKNVVKMTFSKGAALKDPSGLFNSSLDGNTRRAIDFHEGDKIDVEGVEGSRSRCRDPEQVYSPKLADLASTAQSATDFAKRCIGRVTCERERRRASCADVPRVSEGRLPQMRCELQVVVAQFRQAVGRRHKFRIVMRRCSREICPPSAASLHRAFLPAPQ